MTERIYKIIKLILDKFFPMNVLNGSLSQTNYMPTKIQHPLLADIEAWRLYWRTKGQAWRTEPKISGERQRELAQHRTIIPNIEEGIYPFKQMELSRADVEWLLATHEKGQGPIDWSDEKQREREGLDLRGADLRGIDLSGLPLSCMQGGLGWDDIMNKKTKVPTSPAAIHLEKANLEYAHLENANFCDAHLEGIEFSGAHLQSAFLYKAHLEGSAFVEVHMEDADLSSAHLEAAFFNGVHLERAYLFAAYLEGACFEGAHMEDASLLGAYLGGTAFNDVHLEGADLGSTRLGGKVVPNDVWERVHLWNDEFPKIVLPSRFSTVFFDSATSLDKMALGDKKNGFVSLSDISWGNTNLALVDWSSVKMLGNEYEARSRMYSDGTVKSNQSRLHDYFVALRANRQLAIALQLQGLDEDAARFAYRAQILQRTTLRLQKKIGGFLFSWFMCLVAGYGYKPSRSFFAYIFIISIFAIMYHLLGPQLSWNEALVISMTAFHGRGFFPGTFSPADPLAFVSAVEAFVGLIIEVTLIATLTRRLFGK